MRKFISDTEARVLAVAQNDAALSTSEIAQMTKFRSHTVRRSLDGLKERGVTRLFPLINSRALGFDEYDLFFSLALKDRDKRTQILDYFIQHDHVARIEELGGPFDYCVALLAQKVSDVSGFWEEVCERFGELLHHREFTVLESYSGFGRKYLSGTRPAAVVQLSSTKGSQEIDELDHNLLYQLARKPEQSERDLAKSIGSKSSTVHHRLTKLKERRILQGFIWGVRSTRFMRARFRIHIRAKAVSREFRERLARFCQEEMDVVNLCHHIGNWDYSVQVEVENHRDVFEINQRLQCEFPVEIHGTIILPIFDFLKNCPYPFERAPGRI